VTYGNYIISGSVTLHGGPAGDFTRAGLSDDAMMSCGLKSNYSSTAARRASRVTSRYGDTLFIVC